MKQISDVETTTSSRPALLTVLMASGLLAGVRSKRVVCIMEGRALQPTAMRSLDFYDRHPISESQVVGVELPAGRAAGMRRLSRLVGLGQAVHIVRGDATVLPFGAGRFDACVSQEALLHVADKAAVLAEARRVLVAGGRLAFSDWIAHPGLGDVERARLEDWMAAVTLQSLDGYRALLGRVGFRGVE